MPNTYTQLTYHIVFSTKRREPLAIGGMPDHVHIVARLRADPSVARVVQFIKGSSSSWLNHAEKHTGKFSWQEGYGAFTVSPPALQDVLAYVRDQEEHHRYKSFQEEYRRFLDSYHIEYDERYLWD